MYGRGRLRLARIPPHMPQVEISKVREKKFARVTTLLERTQKHDSNRSNKEYCLWLETGRSVEEANKSKKGRGRESEVRAGRQGQNRLVRNIL